MTCKHKSNKVLLLLTAIVASDGLSFFAFDFENDGLKIPRKPTEDFLVLDGDCWSLGISCS